VRIRPTRTYQHINPTLDKIHPNTMQHRTLGDTTDTASLTAVPEPGNLLALSGLVLAGGFMRGRRHAAAPRNK